MKLTDRDKKLLSFVIGIILIVCAYFFGFKNISAKNSELDEVIEEDTKYYRTLKEMAAMEKRFLEDTETYNSVYLDNLNSFDTGLTQQNAILFVSKMEDKTDTWISQVTLGGINTVYSFGQGNTTNPLKDGKAYTSDYKGIEMSLTLSYKATYQDFKNFLHYINTYDSKNKITSVTSSYSEDGYVSGTLVMNRYAITGSDRFFLDVPVSTPFIGTENIFDSSTFKPGEDSGDDNGTNIITDYDYFIALNPVTSSNDSIVVGPKGDRTGVQTVSVSSGKVEELTITFDKNSKGEYVVSYSVGNVSYPAVNYDEGAVFSPTGSIKLLVMGTERDATGEDVNGVKARIINKTDLELLVKIVDDKSSPRFSIAEKSGSVIVYE